jgi:N-carbamoylputrescine amidase
MPLKTLIAENLVWDAAYRNEDDKVVCFFKSAGKFKSRYATLGFNDAANLDAGNMWPTEFALKKLTPGEEKKVSFAPGDTGFPVVEVAGSSFGFPTCWDQWFPELARIYSLEGAEILVYPTAIGSEPHLVEFDTQPLWEQLIVANGLANATFMVVVNRIGFERPLEFYGSSFISDPYGRVLVRAPRDRPTVLVADLDLNHRRNWINFGLITTRRPEQYSGLLDGAAGGVPLDRPGIGPEADR